MTVSQRKWATTNGGLLLGLGAFTVAYLALSWSASPHVIDTYPDSHTYLPISFLGHSERLWAVPLIYFFGGNPSGRIVLQTLIGLGCWIALEVQFGRLIGHRAVRVVGQLVLALLALTEPILQWNRIELSESLALSLTVALFAAWLAFARRMDARSLGVLLLVTVLWAFTRQVQAFIVVLGAIGFVVVAWRKPGIRNVALVGLAGIVTIGLWASLTAQQTSKVLTQVQVAGIIQFRAVTQPGEMSYLRANGLPKVPEIVTPPPFTSTGQPVNVLQFADPFAEYRIRSNPKFRKWVDHGGTSVILKYEMAHPIAAIWKPLLNAPALLTMNPDYASSPAIPQWTSAMVFGNLESAPVSNGPAGSPRSADPVYFITILAVGAVLLLVAAFRRRMSIVIWVAIGGIAFAAAWTIAIWNLAATDYNRIFLPTSVLLHISAIVLIAGCVDALLTSSSGSRSVGRRLNDELVPEHRRPQHEQHLIDQT